MRRATLVLAALVAGCGGGRPPAPAANPAVADWRRVAMPGDRDRLRRWRDAWTRALPPARASRAAEVAAAGLLLDPDRALPGALPPPGAYRCRVLKLGGTAPGASALIAYPAFACRIEAEGTVSSFYKDGGSQRPVGLLFPDTPARAVFLGTMVLGDEVRAIDYGRDAGRDMAGYVERVEPGRWRLVLPWPRFESTLDVIELVRSS
jgi:hypothetical protein